MTGFDFTKSEQYTLSIRLSADGFSFSICHPQVEDDRHLVSFPINAATSMTANLKEMMAASEALKHKYRKTNILIDTPRFTPIPFDLYEDEHLDTLFYHNFPQKDNETILCNILGKSNAVILFGMDKHAHQLLSEHFPDARIFSSVSPLIEHFVSLSRKEQNRSIYVHLKNGKMEAFAFDRGKLLLANSYECKQVNDQTYYLLYLWQQLGFSQENDHLYLTGDIAPTDELPGELQKFLRHTDILPSTWEDFPYDMQTLLICE